MTFHIISLQLPEYKITCTYMVLREHQHIPSKTNPLCNHKGFVLLGMCRCSRKTM